MFCLDVKLRGISFVWFDSVAVYGSQIKVLDSGNVTDRLVFVMKMQCLFLVAVA
jgi:hypothetical protein